MVCRLLGYNIIIVTFCYELVNGLPATAAMPSSLRSLVPILPLLSLSYSAAPWPYLQIYPPVNETDNRTPLFFALMLSSVSFQSIQALPGIQIALDYINKEPSILSDYSLHYTLSDSECDPSTTVAGVFQELQQSPTKLGWLGSGCLTATEFSAPLTQLYNITQISCVTSALHTIDREKYRYYFQVQPMITTLNHGLIGILNEYGWKRVGLITWRDSYFSMIADHFKELLSENDIDFSERLVSTAGFEINGDAFDEDKRIYVLIVASIQARQLLCEAFRRGLKYPRHQFILFGEYSNAWLAEPNPARDLGCTLQERAETLGFALTVNLPDHPDDDTTVTFGGLTATTFRDKFFKQASFPANRHLNLEEKIGSRFPAFAPPCYDATLALALALHNTAEELKHDSALNMMAAAQAGLSQEETFSLANFSYSNSVIVQRVFHYLNRTNFLGITGNQVHFDRNGNRDIDWVMVTQYTNREQDATVQVTDRIYQAVGSVIISDGELQLIGNMSNSLYWPDGIPNDGTPIKRTVTVSLALTVLYTLASVAGIILAIVCGIFNFVNRNKKLIRLSSPKLNYIIILGAIFFYISGILLVLPSLDPSVIVVHCNLTPIFVFTGFSMCYGTILAKMFRVWYIFNHPSLQKKYIITDCYLLGLVIAFVGLDLVMILTFITVQGFRNNLVATLTPSAENPKMLIGPTEVVYENYVYACNAEGRGILIILLFISKIILQVLSLILAFRTRKVKVKGLDDSKYISAAIYITTIVLPVSIFTSFTLRSHVNAFPALLGAAHFFGATAILLLVFVPRMVGLYKDPTGENVFRDKPNSLGQEESNVMALRRDMQQLRVSLHLAQKKQRKTLGTGASQDNLGQPSQPRQAIVKPSVRIEETASNEYSQTHTETKGSAAEGANIAVVKPCLQFSDSTSTTEDDYVRAQIVQN